jgi:hypothetical protein
MADEKIKAEDVKEKPVADTQTDELPEAALEHVTGGGIGSSGGGAGAGKIKPED